MNLKDAVGEIMQFDIEECGGILGIGLEEWLGDDWPAMRVDLFDFDLPDENIALRPASAT